jgi:hypothetical protein
MALTYADALARTRLLVSDSGSTRWADADLQAGIRLALQEVSLFAGNAYTLSGLDGAGSTTLPSLLEGVLVLGAGAYAGQARAVNRAESFELANEGSDVRVWAEKGVAGFLGALERMFPKEQTRTASQKAAVDPPWGGWADDFGEVGRNETD